MYSYYVHKTLQSTLNINKSFPNWYNCIYNISFTDTEHDDHFKPTTGVITPSGGTLTSQYCQLLVPPNAVEVDTVITMTTLKECSTDTMDINVRI